jgi:hypothetical protein
MCEAILHARYLLLNTVRIDNIILEIEHLIIDNTLRVSKLSDNRAIISSLELLEEENPSKNKDTL